MNICETSLEKEIAHEHHALACQCNSILKNYSSNEILTLFCEIFEFNICKISFNSQNKIWNKSFFGSEESSEIFYILELSTFPENLILYHQKLLEMLKKKEKKNFGFKLILKIKNNIEKIKLIFSNPENYFYLRLTNKRPQELKCIIFLYFIDILPIFFKNFIQFRL
jgi:hypothetical protein